MDKAYNCARVLRALCDTYGFTYETLANWMGVRGGADTLNQWESGESSPSLTMQRKLDELPGRLNSIRTNAPFYTPQANPSSFRFIDLFAGVGGIRLPFQKQGGQCVMTSEIDKFSQRTYFANFGDMPLGDITKIKGQDVPDHDILLGGFPCQAFSQAGHGKGFMDTRGTLFFEIQRILAAKRPKMFLLENVKRLKSHDKGKTLKTILNILEGKTIPNIPDKVPMSDEARKTLSQKLNYETHVRVLRATDYGLPQGRERVFIVGFDRDYFGPNGVGDAFQWPLPTCDATRLGDILMGVDEVGLNTLKKYTLSDGLWQGHQKRKIDNKRAGKGFGYSLFNEDSPYSNTLSARYNKDGSEILIDQSSLGLNPRKLMPRECARLQGFPENFVINAVSEAQMYKQFGNSVPVAVIEAIAERMLALLP